MVIEVIAVGCLRAPWLARVQTQNSEGCVLGKVKAGKTRFEQGKQCTGGERRQYQPPTCTGQITDDGQKHLCTALLCFPSLGFSLPRLALPPLARGHGELTAAKC